MQTSKQKRKLFAVVYYLNKVLIIGGYGCDDDREWKKLNTVEIYDPVAKTQTFVPLKMIQSRQDHKVIVYKKKLFVFGGRGEDGFLNTVEMFSLENKKFVEMAPMKIARSSFACCRVGNLVYVIGGYIGGGDKTESVEIYGMDSNTWTDGVDFPFATFALAACAVNNKLE